MYLLFYLSFLLFPICTRRSCRACDKSAFGANSILALKSFCLDSAGCDRLGCTCASACKGIQCRTFGKGSLPFSGMAVHRVVQPRSGGVFLGRTIIFTLRDRGTPSGGLFIRVSHTVRRNRVIIGVPRPIVGYRRVALRRVFVYYIHIGGLPVSSGIILGCVDIIGGRLKRRYQHSRFGFHGLGNRCRTHLRGKVTSFSFAGACFVGIGGGRGNCSFSRGNCPLSCPAHSNDSPGRYVPFGNFGFVPIGPSRTFFVPIDVSSTRGCRGQDEKANRGNCIDPLMCAIICLRPLSGCVRLPGKGCGILGIRGLCHSALVNIGIGNLRICSGGGFQCGLVKSTLFR